MCYYDDEEYWDTRVEPYDETVDNFLKSMKNLVRDEVKKELEELRAFKEKWTPLVNSSENLDRKYEIKIQQLEYEKKNEIEELKRKQRFSGLKDLLEGHEFEVWDVAHETIKAEKCDKCDEDRKIPYKTPLGKDAQENCSCDKYKNVYEPIPFTLYQIRKNRENKAVLLYKFKEYKDDPHWDNLTYYGSFGDESTKSSVDIITDSKDFENYRSWYHSFATKELAKEYCEWRNAKEEWKSNAL